LGAGAVPLALWSDLREERPRVHKMVTFHHIFSGFNPRYLDSVIRKADQITTSLNRFATKDERNTKAL
jgi:hypothetical protein